MTESKDDIIKRIYNNPVSGYGSLRDTYQQAYKIDPTIRQIDVKNYLDSLQHRQTQFKYKGENSFVSPHPLFEIELDLVDMTAEAEANNGYRYGFVGIDNFTKFAVVQPMKTKTAKDIIEAMNIVLHTIGIPKQICSEFEGGVDSPDFQKLLNLHNIKRVTTIRGAHTVERFNRTLK